MSRKASDISLRFVRPATYLTLILSLALLTVVAVVFARAAGDAAEAVAPAARPTARIETARRFEMPGRTVVLNQFLLDASETVIEYDVLSEEHIEPKCAWYLLFDQNGALLNIDYALSLTIDTREENGAFVVSLSVSGRALPETVESIRFVPVCTLERLDGENAEDYYLRMAALAEENECFTVSLDDFV